VLDSPSPAPHSRLLCRSQAGREAIDVYELFAFANPIDATTPECDISYAGECPVYDLTNGLSYTGSWAEDGSAYTLRLQCPVPAGTPMAAGGDVYAGASPPPYLVGNNTITPPLTYNAYEIRVARLRVGVTRVRLRADVRNTARNLRQPLLTGEFGSVDEPFIVSYAASLDLT
jgi:hypothetical protein